MYHKLEEWGRFKSVCDEGCSCLSQLPSIVRNIQMTVSTSAWKLARNAMLSALSFGDHIGEESITLLFSGCAYVRTLHSGCLLLRVLERQGGALIAAEDLRLFLRYLLRFPYCSASHSSRQYPLMRRVCVVSDPTLSSRSLKHPRASLAN